MSSGDSADGVTPSAATGATFEPLRSLQWFTVSGIPSGPASGMAGDRGDDLADGTRPQRSGGSGPSASSSSGLFPAQREGNQTAIPGHGTGPQHHAAGCAGLVSRSSIRARSAHLNEEQKGAKPPGSNEADFCHRADHLTCHDEVV